MAHRKAPLHIAKLFDKPGREWTEDEKNDFLAWLQVPEQFVIDGTILGVVLFRQAPGTREDVEDALVEFHGRRLDGVIRNYTPKKGDQTKSTQERFFAYYNSGLRNLAREFAEKVRAIAHAEQAPDDDADGDGAPWEIGVNWDNPEDAAIQSERIRMLRDCIDRVLTPFERSVVHARMEGVPYAALAAQLQKTSVAVRVCYARALAKLRKCLTEKAAARAKSKSPTKALGAIDEIDVDVLIIGGGVMALFLANELRRLRYSVVLLEQDRLGGGQTCHSHLYIHDGHLYGDVVPLAMAVKAAEKLWRAWLEDHPEVERAHMPSIFGFRTERQATERRLLWEHPDLALSQTRLAQPPECLFGGDVAVAYESPEICVRGRSLVEALKKPIDELIGRVTALSFSIRSSPSRIDRVDALLPSGKHIAFRPRAVVLAAGAGNQAILDSIAAVSETPMEVSAAQQIRQSHMLAIRGRRDKLPLMTGVFKLSHTLFIVARARGDEIVWLVSDERGPSIKGAKRYDLDWWRPGIVNSLRELAPAVFDHPERLNLEWWGYEAPKAEGRAADDRRPPGPSIEQYGVRNLWAAWPTKLTLAPLATQTLVQQVGDLVGVGSRWNSPPPTWSAARCEVEAADERWEEAPADAWKRNWGGQ